MLPRIISPFTKKHILSGTYLTWQKVRKSIKVSTENVIYARIHRFAKNSRVLRLFPTSEPRLKYNILLNVLRDKISWETFPISCRNCQPRRKIFSLAGYYLKLFRTTLNAVSYTIPFLLSTENSWQSFKNCFGVLVTLPKLLSGI